MTKPTRLKKPAAIFFDLDGTLVDSAPDLSASLKAAFNTLNLDPPNEKDVRHWIGNGVDKLLHRALTNSMNGTAEGDDFWRARNLFFTDYAHRSGESSTLYSGVLETLEWLTQNDILLVCITNKNRCFTEPLLEKLGINRFFNLTVCGDDLSNKKPHPEPLLYAASHLNISHRECIMVGDSKSDISAANAAEITVFCVDYGYSQGVDLSELKIDSMLSSIAEVEDHFDHHSLKQCG